MKSNFEAGGAHLRLNVAAFHSKYKGGLQFINVRNTTGIPATTPDAPNRGSVAVNVADMTIRSEEHTSELQSLMRISYAVFCLKTKNTTTLSKDCSTEDILTTL